MESQIVGYESIALEPGNQLIKGVMFQNVSGMGLDIQAIKLDDNTACDGTSSMWWWNGTSYDVASVWCPSYDEDGNPIDENGNVVDDESKAARVWGDDVNWIATVKNFKKGECFWIQPSPDNTSSAMVPAGALATSDSSVEYVAIELDPGEQVQVTSPMPVGTFMLKDARMDDATACDGTTSAWWWNGSSYDVAAVWCPAYNEDGNPIDEDGNVVDDESKAAHIWGDDVNWIEITKQFASGEGFWVQPSPDNESSSILFKNPLYKAN